MSFDSDQRVDVQAFIDQQPVGRFHFLVLGLCFAITAADGFDTAAIGFIAPAIREGWGLSAAQMSPLLGSGLVGLMFGAFAAGPLADRFGRKRLLCLCVLLFGVFCTASVFAGNALELTVLRFLTGVGLGGAMPSAITLTSEYCPRHRRSLMVTVMFCGFTLGSALSGVIASYLLPVHGWRSVLLLGGLMPLLLLPFLLLFMPESVRFLVLRKYPADAIAGLMRRLGPLKSSATTVFHLADSNVSSTESPARIIFSRQLRLGTALLWIICAMSMGTIYVMTNWLPTLLRDSGLSLSLSAQVSAWFQIGGTLGAVALGALMDRLDPWRVLALAYLGGALALWGMSQLHDQYVLLILCVAALGMCISGSQVGANVLAASFYPTSGRATGVAWAQGVGRIGAISGTLLGGQLIAGGLGGTTIFLLLAIPALLACAAVFYMGQHYRAPIAPALVQH